MANSSSPRSRASSGPRPNWQLADRVTRNAAQSHRLLPPTERSISHKIVRRLPVLQSSGSNCSVELGFIAGS